MHWLKGLNSPIRFKEPLNIHTTLHTGGPADVWIEPNNFADLRKIICTCVKEKVPYLVIGKGSNILFSDRGFNGVTICLKSGAFTKLRVKEDNIFCGAGLLLAKVIKRAQREGLGGLEFLAGIPASIGGALVMNAGNRTNNIGSLVKNVTAMDGKGRVCVLKRDQLKFAYRRSNLEKYVVLEAQLELVERSPKMIKENILTFYGQKRRAQDLSAKSAGCIFKNPPHHLSAGEMIEICGLKRKRHGGAEISSRHANYIINRGNAKTCDILYLIDLVQKTVQDKFGVHLKPEIKIVK